jgi:hypothetical protein
MFEGEPNFPTKSFVLGVRAAYHSSRDLLDLVTNSIQEDVTYVVDEFFKIFCPELRYYVSCNIRTGYLSRDWNPEVLLSLDEVYATADLNEVLPKKYGNITHGKVLKIMNGELLGRLPEYINTKIVYKLPPEGIRSEEDIKSVLGSHVSLHVAGQVWYKGWYIPDVYFIVWDDFKKYYRMFLSMDGHGGYAEEIMDTDVFFGFIEQDDSNDHLRKDWQEAIKDSQAYPMRQK